VEVLLRYDPRPEPREPEGWKDWVMFVAFVLALPVAWFLATVGAGFFHAG
jgi:hypothetical protein